MSDYSEWGEGKIIAQFFQGFVGRFLNIGALDGIDRDNCYGLFKEGWTGVCVEASPFCFTQLLRNYKGDPRVACVHAAMMPTSGIVKFYDTFNEQTGSHHHTSTCLEAHDEKVTQLVKREYYLAAISPVQLAGNFGTDYDFVSLDIEGMDIPVLRAMGPVLKATRLLCVEDTIPAREFDQAYYDELVNVARAFGFTRLAGRTKTNTGRCANSLLARE